MTTSRELVAPEVCLVPVSVLLARVARELQELALSVHGLQDAVSPLLMCRSGIGQAQSATLQSIDLTSQSLDALADTLTVISAAASCGCSVNASAVSDGISLSELAERISLSHEARANLRGSGRLEVF